MRIAVPETAGWPFGDRTEIGADELNAYLAGSLETSMPPVETVEDWRTSEKKFLAKVVKHATDHGWMSYHTWASANSAPGFPDLVLVRGDRLIFAELKVGTNRPTKDQTAWLDALAGAGVPAYLWRPEDWAEIERTLG
jgi:hypothetical protein